MIGFHFRDRAATIAMDRKVTGDVVNGCEKMEVHLCEACRKTLLRKVKKS
jgi:hypothetical protein